MVPGARSKLGAPMFEAEVFCDIVGTFRFPPGNHSTTPAVIQRPHGDLAPGELCPPRYAPAEVGYCTNGRDKIFPKRLWRDTSRQSAYLRSSQTMKIDPLPRINRFQLHWLGYRMYYKRLAIWVLLAAATGKQPRGRSKTRQRDYKYDFASSRLGVEPAELWEIAENHETAAPVTLLIWKSCVKKNEWLLPFLSRMSTSIKQQTWINRPFCTCTLQIENHTSVTASLFCVLLFSLHTRHGMTMGSPGMERP